MKHIFDIYEGIFDKDNIKNVGNSIDDSAYTVPTMGDFVKIDNGRWSVDISHPKLLKVANKFEFFGRKDFVKITLDVKKIGHCWKNVIRLHQKNNRSYRSYPIELSVGDFNPIDAKKSAIYRIEMWYDDPQEFGYILDFEYKHINEGIFDTDKRNVGANLDSFINIPTIDEFRENYLRKSHELIWKSDYFNQEFLDKNLDKEKFRYYTPDLVKHGIKISIYRERGVGIHIEFYTVTRSIAWIGYLGRLETHEKNYDKVKKQVIQLLQNIKYKNIGKDIVIDVFNNKRMKEIFIEDYI